MTFCRILREEKMLTTQINRRNVLISNKYAVSELFIRTSVPLQMLNLQYPRRAGYSDSKHF